MGKGDDRLRSGLGIGTGLTVRTGLLGSLVALRILAVGGLLLAHARQKTRQRIALGPTLALRSPAQTL